MSPATVRGWLKQPGMPRSRLSASAPVYLAAVLDFVMQSILEVSKDALKCKKGSKERAEMTIMPRHVVAGMDAHPELRELCAHSSLKRGGVAN